MFAGRSAIGFEEAKKQGHVAISKGDNLPRFFIDDSAARIKPPFDRNETFPTQYTEESGNTLRLDKFLHHPKLFKAYPELRSLKVHAELVEKTQRSSCYRDYSGIVSLIFFQDDTGIRRTKTVLHEIQHAIQSLEGHNRGTSYSAELGDVLSEKKKLYAQARWLAQDAGKSKAAIERLGRLDDTLTRALFKEHPSHRKLSSEHVAVLPRSMQENFKRLADNRYYNAPGEVEARETAMVFGLSIEKKQNYSIQTLQNELRLFRKGQSLLDQRGVIISVNLYRGYDTQQTNQAIKATRKQGQLLNVRDAFFELTRLPALARKVAGLRPSLFEPK